MADSKLSGLDYQQILVEASHRWLRPAEICEILQNHERLTITISQEPAEMPKSGSLFLYDRKVRFRKDGHRWKKTKAGKTVKEGHEKLRCKGVLALNCYYAHAEENENFQRRSYWMLEEDLSRIVLVHYREVKAHVRDHQVRKHHRPTVCSWGIQKKVILDCRQEGSGSHVSNPQPIMQSMQDSSSKDDPNLLKDELTEEMLQNALARVKSPVQYPQQRDQYRHLLNVITEILETKVPCDNFLNGPERTTNVYDDLKDIKALLDADNLVPIETSKVVSDNVLNGPEGTTNYSDDHKACLDLDEDTFFPTETSKVACDNVLNGPEGTTNFYDELKACLDLDVDFFLPTETSKVVYDNVLNGPEGPTNFYDELKACLDLDVDLFLPTETSKVVCDNVLNGPEGTTNFSDELKACLDLDADLFLPTETSKVVCDNVPNGLEGTTNFYDDLKDLKTLLDLDEDNFVPTETSKILLKQGHSVPPITPDWINCHSPCAQGWDTWYTDDNLMSNYHN